MCTKIKFIVSWIANSVVYDCARWDVIKRSMLEKLCMMVSLRTNQHKFGRPFLLDKLTSLNNLIQLDVQNLIELELTDSIPEYDNLFMVSCAWQE